MINILVINGPNLNLLGLREPELYGRQDYQALCQLLEQTATQLNMRLSIFQSNHEGAIVDKIQAAWGVYDAMIINPAAYTHTSIAILDALKAVQIPTVEVHLTDIHTREPFRQHSYISPACLQTICGHGFDGYVMAMEFLSGHCNA